MEEGEELDCIERISITFENDTHELKIVQVDGYKKQHSGEQFEYFADWYNDSAVQFPSALDAFEHAMKSYPHANKQITFQINSSNEECNFLDLPTIIKHKGW